MRISDWSSDVCSSDLRVWRPFDLGNVLFGFLPDRNQRVDERIKRLAILGFGRLDQQAFRDKQREVDRRRVKSIIEQALGDIGRRQLDLLLLFFQRYRKSTRLNSSH